MASLLENQTFADYVTTQRCFDAVATIAWVSEVRDNGVKSDLWAVGFLGVVMRVCRRLRF